MRLFGNFSLVVFFLLSVPALAQAQVGTPVLESEVSVQTTGDEGLLVGSFFRMGGHLDDLDALGMPFELAQSPFLDAPVTTRTAIARLDHDASVEDVEAATIRPQVFDFSTPERSGAAEPITLAVLAAGILGITARRHRRSRMI